MSCSESWCPLLIYSPFTLLFSKVSGTKARLLKEQTIFLSLFLPSPHPISFSGLNPKPAVFYTVGRTIHPSAKQKFCPFILLPSSPNLSKMRPGFLRTESPSTGVAHLPVRLSVAWLTKAWRAGVQSTWKGRGA